MGDALGIGSGIIRPAGGAGNAREVATTDSVAALWASAAIREPTIADGAADGLRADALLAGRFTRIQFFVEPGLGGHEQFSQEGGSRGGGLVGPVLPKRVGLALRFADEGREPVRKIP